MVNLMRKHVPQRRTMCRLFHENYLAGEKCKYVVTIDEA